MSQHVTLGVRWRLTLAYSLIFAFTSAVLLTLVYLVVRQAERPSPVVTGNQTAGLAVAPPPADGLVLSGPGPQGGPAEAAEAGGVWVQVRQDAVNGTLDQFLQWSVLGLILMTVVSVGIGWLIAGRVLTPIQSAFDSERRLVATMSHELRTPLANQQVALDVALADPDAGAAELRRAAELALTQSRRANGTIEALLALARVQAGDAEPARAPVDLGALVAEAVEQVRCSAPGPSGLTWDVDLADVTVHGDPELLRRAVVNLVHNAAAYNVVGGSVTVGLECADGAAHLVVLNTGPDVPAEVAADLVLPFRRGTRDRTASDRGLGLGLSIAQAVTDHHRGRLVLTARPGGGLHVRLSLPVGAPARP